MKLEKIVTDWYTMYSSPSKIGSLKNCTIYLSYSNLQKIKEEINKIANDKNMSSFQKQIELSSFEAIIAFIKKNNSTIEADYLETEPLAFISENNSYIVIVKEVKDFRLLSTHLNELTVKKEENDTIYIALVEEAQILTTKDSLCYMLKEYEVPVFVLNIKDK